MLTVKIISSKKRFVHQFIVVHLYLVTALLGLFACSAAVAADSNTTAIAPASFDHPIIRTFKK